MNADQQLFADTARRFLEERLPLDERRGRSSATDPLGADRWHDAAGLGWTTLLVPEAAGGGSITGRGLSDLVVLARLLGREAAPGPFLATNVVAHALGRWGDAAHHEGALAAILEGRLAAAWAPDASVTARVEGDATVLDGTARRVEVGGPASSLLVAVDGPAGRALHLVDLAAQGATLTPRNGIDITRRFVDVDLREVAAGAPLDAGDVVEAEAHLLDITGVLAAAEIAGCLERAVELTMPWLAERHSFGRPLASYQEIKHRMADTRTHLEACEAIVGRAAGALDDGGRDARELACAAIAYASRHAVEAIQDCIQLHGGIGVTVDHDLHLYLRRATLDANLHGTHHDHARRLGRLVAAGARKGAA